MPLTKQHQRHTHSGISPLYRQQGGHLSSYYSLVNDTCRVKKTMNVISSIIELFVLFTIKHQIDCMQTSTQSINFRFKDREQMINYSEKTGKTLVSLGDYVLDASTFSKHHPGGKATLEAFANQPIDEQMKTHFPLSMLLANSMVVGTFKREISRIIDPERPLLRQIWNLDQENYGKVINSPHWLFVPSPRMVEWDWLEILSYSRWYQVSFLPALLITYMLVTVSTWQSFNPLTSLLAIICGVLSFTLVEYLLHRFIFHADWYIPDNRVLRMLHFVLHGVHHMLPNDPNRLVLPPPFALIITILAYPTVVKLIPIQDPVLFVMFWSAYLIGYVVYDSTHYFLHFLDTSSHVGTLFQKLQKYHNQHHYGGQHAGFGVSSPLWDIIFRSRFKKGKKESTD